ncbi:MAG: hypothetical protein L0241_07705, partial [Planctomycetia bacterium]|nr:hypothetical protein [Planctomycetia bacterium]
MSTAPTPAASGSAPPGAPPPKREITLISHSMLFYWWPIWLLGFIMALMTLVEDHRLAVMPNGVTVAKVKEDEKYAYYELGVVKGAETKSLTEAVERSKPVPGAQTAAEPFPTRVSQKVWMAPLFCVVLLLTVVITNVPLRGLWSFLVLLMFLVIALLISLIPDGWDKLLTTVGHLHIYINMAGYLFIATVVFIL